MTARSDSLPKPEAPTTGSTRSEDWSWQGVRAGFAGAAAVALVFFVADLFAGRPLWVPTALGAALYRGEALTAHTEPELVLVVGYTAFHATIFVALGTLASFILRSQNASWWNRPLVLTMTLFASLEVLSLVGGAALSRPLIGVMGIAWISVANLSAAVGMGYVLAGRKTMQ